MRRTSPLGVGASTVPLRRMETSRGFQPNDARPWHGLAQAGSIGAAVAGAAVAGTAIGRARVARSVPVAARLRSRLATAVARRRSAIPRALPGTALGHIHRDD